MKPKRLPFKEFKDIYSKVPRLCVDLVIKNSSGIILVERDIEPYKGYWHLPGGSVLFGEKIDEAIKRVALEETGLVVKMKNQLGYIEYPILDPIGHTITIVFLLKPISGKLKGSKQGENVRYFKSIPEKTIDVQKDFLLKNNL